MDCKSYVKPSALPLTAALFLLVTGTSSRGQEAALQTVVEAAVANAASTWVSAGAQAEGHDDPLFTKVVYTGCSTNGCTTPGQQNAVLQAPQQPLDSLSGFLLPHVQHASTLNCGRKEIALRSALNWCTQRSRLWKMGWPRFGACCTLC